MIKFSLKRILESAPYDFGACSSKELKHRHRLAYLL